ncbi:MAG TPA: hypothetical protein VIY49_26440 [Bryobacteraceae bacterium]
MEPERVGAPEAIRRRDALRLLNEACFIAVPFEDGVEEIISKRADLRVEWVWLVVQEFEFVLVSHCQSRCGEDWPELISHLTKVPLTFQNLISPIQLVCLRDRIPRATIEERELRICKMPGKRRQAGSREGRPRVY